MDRFYIEDFLRSWAPDIRGEVLEVGDAGYTRLFGGSRVTGSHVLDIEPGNTKATVVADLSEADSLPAGRFQCFVLIQTLQYVSDVDVALRNAWRALAPGGTLLVTVPTLSGVDPEARESDVWRLTPGGLERVLGKSCPDAEVEVRGYGNLLAGTAFLMGLATEELKGSEIRFRDPVFPMLACARAKKADG